ncbi:hypothetical protein [Deinococcus planocerae]|uniref:hypothetical protein n=1 Tax=Deinococcus planocerae TaxID=1737569 RepID=UPI0011AEE10D|nr:hypothetical protein [Deinococcus planocerae]
MNLYQSYFQLLIHPGTYFQRMGGAPMKRSHHAAIVAVTGGLLGGYAVLIAPPSPPVTTTLSAAHRWVEQPWLIDVALTAIATFALWGLLSGLARLGTKERCQPSSIFALSFIPIIVGTATMLIVEIIRRYTQQSMTHEAIHVLTVLGMVVNIAVLIRHVQVAKAGFQAALGSSHLVNKVLVIAYGMTTTLILSATMLILTAGSLEGAS